MSKYKELLERIGDDLTDLSAALEKEVVETRCESCDRPHFLPVDKSRALEQVHGFMEKILRFQNAEWAKTEMPE